MQRCRRQRSDKEINIVLKIINAVQRGVLISDMHKERIESATRVARHYEIKLTIIMPV